MPPIPYSPNRRERAKRLDDHSKTESVEDFREALCANGGFLSVMTEAHENVERDGFYGYECMV